MDRSPRVSPSLASRGAPYDGEPAFASSRRKRGARSRTPLERCPRRSSYNARVGFDALTALAHGFALDRRAGSVERREREMIRLLARYWGCER
jgi:hypothetical protein